MQSLAQDVRYALRLFLKSPLYTVVALATLAIGVAANAAIFSIVHALLLRPLPYPEPERLVMVWQDLRARGGPENEWLAPAHYFDLRTRGRSFETSAVYRGGTASLTGIGEPEQLFTWQVTSEFFRVLGVSPALGRDFRPEDDRPGAPATVILTDATWKRRFGSNPAIVGQSITLNREPHVVIGVLPAQFRSPFPAPAIFRPVQLDPVQPSRGNITLRMFARLKPDVRFEQAQAELQAVGAALAAEHPATDAGSTIRLTRLEDETVQGVRTPLLALMGAVVLVLLIACANIAGLQLARASARARELAVRTAIGAGRLRLVRQLLTESALLGLLGAGGGVLLSSWFLAGFIAVAPEGTARLEEVRIDGVVLAFAILLALTTSILFGIAPALHSVRGDVAAAVREGVRDTGSRQGAGIRGLFVVGQLALALTLLVGGGLLMRSLAELRGVDPGFQPDRLLTALVALPANGYEKPPQVRVFYSSLLERLEATPGVTSAALASVLPFTGEDTDTSFEIVGRPPAVRPADEPVAWYRIVSDGYLRAIGMQMERGRFIEPTDVEGTQKVAVINRTLANRYWRNQDPVGQRIRNGDREFTIVGIVRDVHHRNLNEAPRGEMFLSYQQFTSRRATLVVKTESDPVALLPAIRGHLAAIDPYVPLARVATMEELMADSLALPRMMAVLMAAFSGAALLLAALGVYGLIAYTVMLRRHEFGVRMALGAGGNDVLRLVLGGAARLTTIGVAIGTVGAFAAARGIRTLLFGVTATDVPTFVATAILLAGIALLASYLPARRAVRVDPASALRAE